MSGDNGQLFLFNSLDVCQMCEEPFIRDRDFCSDDCELKAMKVFYWLEMAALELKPWKYIVYVIERGGFYKIGYTKQAFSKRMGDLRTGSHCPINVIFKFHTNSGPEIERNLHEQYKDKQINSEWYELDREDLDEIYISLSIFVEQSKCKFECKQEINEQHHMEYLKEMAYLAIEHLPREVLQQVEIPELEEDLTIETFGDSPKYKDNGR